LNNDYYLDLKTEALNQYIENNITSHVDDKEIHFTWSSIVKLITDNLGTTKNNVYKLPLYQNNQKYGLSLIKETIRKCPRNLNQYITVFEFCIPVSEVIGKMTKNFVLLTRENYKQYLKLDTTQINSDELLRTN
jgi:hypothetical protein